MGDLNVPIEMGNADSGWDFLVSDWPYLVRQDTDLPIMVIKGTSFLSRVNF